MLSVSGMNIKSCSSHLSKYMCKIYRHEKICQLEIKNQRATSYCTTLSTEKTKTVISFCQSHLFPKKVDTSQPFVPSSRVCKYSSASLHAREKTGLLHVANRLIKTEIPVRESAVQSSTSANISMPDEIDHLEFAILKEKDINDTLDFLLENYTATNALIQGLHATKEDMEEFLAWRIRKAVPYGASGVVRDIRTGQIVAVWMCTIIDRGDVSAPVKDEFQTDNIKVKYMKEIAGQIKSEDIFHDPSVHRILSGDILCVDVKRAGKGLGLRITELFAGICLSKGAQAIIGKATHAASRELFKKFGATELYILDYSTAVVDGKHVLDLSAMGKHTRGSLVYRKISSLGSQQKFC